MCGTLFSVLSYHPQSCWKLLLCQMLQLQLWPLFSSIFFTPLTSPFNSIYTFSTYSYSFSIYCFSINTCHPPLPTYHYFKTFSFFFYCSDLSLVPFFHKPLLTQHKARGRRRSLSQKQAHPDTSDTRANSGLRI